MKPRIYLLLGRWYCAGVPGSDPGDAFKNWQAKRDVWRYVPCGYVPR